MKFNGNVQIIQKEYLQPDVFRIRVERPAEMESVKPGQFFNFTTSRSGFPLLRRPISISGYDDQTIEFTVKIIGKGTQLLSEIRENESVEMMGPLGNGFEISQEKKILIVGGGIGIAPVKGLLEQWKNAETQIDVLLGYRDTPYLNEAFEKLAHSVEIVSESDSNYRKGYVTQPFIEKINQSKYDMIYACGPEIMLKTLAKICNELDQPIQLLMEEKMACGIGACLVCTCKVKKDDFNHKNVRTCKEGPMFYGKEVVFDE